jgi:hypothetical protein
MFFSIGRKLKKTEPKSGEKEGQPGAPETSRATIMHQRHLMECKFFSCVDKISLWFNVRHTTIHPHTSVHKG